jgi:hypothetical protein
VPPHFLQVDLQQLCIVATNSNTIIKTKSSKKLEVMGLQRCLNVIWAQGSCLFWKGKDYPLSSLCKDTQMSKGNAHIFCWTVKDSIRHRNSVENARTWHAFIWHKQDRQFFQDSGVISTQLHHSTVHVSYNDNTSHCKKIH